MHTHTHKDVLVFWQMFVTLVSRKLRQEDYTFDASLNYIVRPCLKQNKTNILKRNTMEAIINALRHMNKNKYLQAHATWFVCFFV